MAMYERLHYTWYSTPQKNDEMWNFRKKNLKTGYNWKDNIKTKLMEMSCNDGTYNPEFLNQVDYKEVKK